MWGIFFGEFQCLPVDDCPAASCDSGVLTRGSESMSFYSAILVHSSQFLFIYFISNLSWTNFIKYNKDKLLITHLNVAAILNYY